MDNIQIAQPDVNDNADHDYALIIDASPRISTPENNATPPSIETGLIQEIIIDSATTHESKIMDNIQIAQPDVNDNADHDYALIIDASPRISTPENNATPPSIETGFIQEIIIDSTTTSESEIMDNIQIAQPDVNDNADHDYALIIDASPRISTPENNATPLCAVNSQSWRSDVAGVLPPGTVNVKAYSRKKKRELKKAGQQFKQDNAEFGEASWDHIEQAFDMDKMKPEGRRELTKLTE
ncbi:hypothetical protein HCN44_004914 [Aphidius gifuensis]|uniref:Uncharacterized protein n=1 Tax=Aphidius gifuensis TaxID=684658 RepID=A0A835CTQ5_APHGI|nr:hypothetical protein HCN44_004914 [Aphidius gifuensis]